jgi:hypothetical protein
MAGIVITPNYLGSSVISGQVTVTTAGTSIQCPDIELSNGAYIKGLGDNTGKMYVWNATGDGRTGFELSAGETIPVQVANLNMIWIDASVGGEKVCWIKG